LSFKLSLKEPGWNGWPAIGFAESRKNAAMIGAFCATLLSDRRSEGIKSWLHKSFGYDQKTSLGG
jgi:hypothetical protein